MDMTLIDALIILVLLVGTVAGFLRGIISQVASIVGFVLGIFACLSIGSQATELLVTLIPSAASWPLAEFTTAAIAQGTLFMLVMLTCRVIAFSVKGLARRAKLRLADRLGGSALGAFKNMMVLSLLLNLWFVISPTSSAFTTQGSLGSLPVVATLNLAPSVFGLSVMPGDSLDSCTRAIAKSDSIAADSADACRQAKEKEE
mgnify:FL=1